MNTPSDLESDKAEIRQKILGLGEQSIHKNYYPQLQARIQELEESQARLEEKSAALHESEERYRIISELSSDFAYCVQITPSGEWATEWCLGAVTRITGYTLEVSKQFELWSSIIWPEDRPKIQQYLQMLLAGHPGELEYRIIHKSGEMRWLHSRNQPVWDDTAKTVVRIYGATQDITERKQVEEKFLQAQKMEAIGRLTAGVAHDFNNLLTVINGFSELLLSRVNQPADWPRQELEQIRQAGQRATGLTRQLLAFSRKQTLQPEVLDLNRVISGLDKMLHRLISEDISLMTILTPDLGLIKADPGQLEQVLINLAVNARDAMPDGGHLTIETTNVELGGSYIAIHPEARAGPYILLTVRDDGIGMGDEIKGHLFEPFFTTKELGKGTGLGLAAVYGIIRQSEGHITVYSEVGRGTTFRIYLPRLPVASQAEAPLLQGNIPIPSGNETILLTEDDSNVRRLTRRMLEEQGYTILEASNGPEALQVAGSQAGPIHLLLTDVIMPGMNGKTLAVELSQRCPGLKVIFMSGYTDDAIVHHGVLEPHFAFLAKPFSQAALVHKVRAVLDAFPI